MNEPAPFITVVSGLPRSGTSLMMQMLDAGGLVAITDALRQRDADNPKGYYEFERVKQLPQGDIAWLEDAQGKVVKIISMLLTHLPAGYQYRVIFMRRQLPEILASQRQMLIRRGEDPNKVSDAELTPIFEKHLQMVEGWMQKQPQVAFLNVHYHELVQQPAPVVEQINQFLGNRLAVGKMLQSVDQGLYRNRVG